MDQLSSLHDNFLLEGLSVVQVRYMGDDMVLLTGPEEEKLEDIMKNAEEWLEGLFYDLTPWNPQSAPGFRVTWVRCTGLPLHLWRQECFEKMVLPLGDLIAVDTKTENFMNLEFSRLQIKTSELDTISHFRKIKINGVVYGIRIAEEVGLPGCCNRMFDAKSVAASSSWAQSEQVDDSIFSDDQHDDGSWEGAPAAAPVAEKGGEGRNKLIGSVNALFYNDGGYCNKGGVLDQPITPTNMPLPILNNDRDLNIEPSGSQANKATSGGGKRRRQGQRSN